MPPGPLRPRTARCPPRTPTATISDREMNQAANPSTDRVDETSGRAPVPRCSGAVPRAKSMRRSTPACANSRPRSCMNPSASRAAFLYLEDFLPRDYTERLIDARARGNARREPQLPAGPQAGRQREPPRHRPSRAVHRRPVPVGGADQAGSKQSAATRCSSRPPTTRMPTRSISTRVRATTSAGTTTRPITKAAVTRCCSA